MSQSLENINAVLDGLKIDGYCVNYEEHRHLAFFDVQLNPGTLVSRLERRTKEIALALKSKTTPTVKILSSEGVIRLQMAISDLDVLYLTNILHGSKISKNHGLIPVVLGETDEGKNFWIDLSKHPHTLIAGGTGSGKSVLMRTIIANLAMLKKFDARDIKLFLSDPKRVEFNAYKDPAFKSFIPFIANDYESTIGMLKYIDNVMESRYEIMARLGYSSVEEKTNLFPQIVVMIDEASDLMLQDKKSKKFETLVVKLAQKCRAAGIYIVLATQRPSVDVLTGLIKANFPARISCKVSSRVDSQVILDAPGAENLLGRGDAILQSPVLDKVRFQVAYITAKEILSLYK